MEAEKREKFCGHEDNEDSTCNMLLPFIYQSLLFKDLHMFAVVLVAAML